MILVCIQCQSTKFYIPNYLFSTIIVQHIVKVFFFFHTWYSSPYQAFLLCAVIIVFFSLCMQSATPGSTCTSRVVYMSALQASRLSPSLSFPLITMWLLSCIQPACPAMSSALPAAAQGQETVSHAHPTATWTYSLVRASTRTRFSVNHPMLGCSNCAAAPLLAS